MSDTITTNNMSMTTTVPSYSAYTIDSSYYNAVMEKLNNRSYSDCLNSFYNKYIYESDDKITKITISKRYFDFEYIKEIVPEKVYEFTFYDRSKVKTIREENDPFDLEYMFYLALAKKLYSKEYTFEGVLFKSHTLQYEKKYVKAVKKGIKLFNKLKEEEFKKKEYDEMKKRQHEKQVRRKKEIKERKRKEQVNIIAEAIRQSKEEG